MPNTKQTQLWQRIERDATAAGQSPGEYMRRNPERYVAYQDAAAKSSPLHNNPAARQVEERVAEKVAAGMGKGEAYAAVLGHGGDPALYDRYKAEVGKRLPNAPKGANGGTDSPKKGPLAPDEMVELQRQAKAVGVDLTLDEIARSGWVNARQLLSDLNDGTLMGDDDSEESFGESVRFTDLDDLP